MASKSDKNISRPKDARIPHITMDPCLPNGLFTKPLEYINAFIDNFMTLVQGKRAQKQVRGILMKAIDDMFRPMNFYDRLERRDPISIKKLKKGIAHGARLK